MHFDSFKTYDRQLQLSLHRGFNLKECGRAVPSFMPVSYGQVCDEMVTLRAGAMDLPCA